MKTIISSYAKTVFVFLCCFYFMTSCNAGNTPLQAPEIRVYPQLGHSHAVSAASFSQDGHRIVSGSWDMTVKVWDAETGRETETFSGHTDRVVSTAISPGGGLIASASLDGTVRIWDLRSGQEAGRLEEGAFSVTFGDDDNKLITASSRGVKLWDIKKRKTIKTFTGESSVSVSFDHENKVVAAVSKGIKIWHTDTGEETAIADDLTNTIALNSDGKYIACGTWDGNVFLRETRRGETVAYIKACSGKINAVSFSNSGQYIATASDDGEIILWNTQNTDTFRIFSGHSGSVNSLAFSPDDKFIVSASSDKTLKIWDIDSGEAIKTMGSRSDPPTISVMSHDNKYIASLSRNNFIKIWNAETGEIIDRYELSDPANSIFFTGDDSGIMTVSPEGDVRTVSIKTGKETGYFPGHSKDLSLGHVFCIDGENIVSVLLNGNIRVTNYKTGQRTEFEQGDRRITTAAALSPDGKYLAAGFFDGRISIRDLAGGKTTTSKQYKSRVEFIQFSADGNLLVFGLQNGMIRIYDVKSGRETAPGMKHIYGISSVSFSWDNRYIISSAYDNTSRLWDLKTGKEIAAFISFSDDEWIVITGDGFYNSSPRGDEYLNVNAGNEIYGMDQFSAVFYQPELVKTRLQGISDLDTAPWIGESRISMAPPAVQIEAPRESHFGISKITVSIKDNFHPLNNIQIVINGRLLGAEELRLFTGTENLEVENTRLVLKGTAYELRFSIPVYLEAGSNHVQVIASNSNSPDETAPSAGLEGRKSVYINNTSDSGLKQPDLWLLAIGSSNYLYMPPEGDLKYSVNNARGIKALFESQQGKRYGTVHARIIADGEEIAPTRANIIENIRHYFKDAHSNDVLVLYMSGHGATFNEVLRTDSKDGVRQYYFLPQDVPTAPNGETDYSQAISLDDIDVLLNLPGRKFIFIDSCFSGGIDNGRLVRKMKNQSTAIFASSLEGEISREGSEAVGYGIFTDSLISGIRGEAAANNRIRVLSLADYVYNKVALLSGGEQHPYRNIPEGFNNFVLAEVPTAAP